MICHPGDARVGFLVRVCMLLMTVSLGGCRGYSAVSEFEEMQNRKERFRELVKEMGGTAEEKYYRVAGQEGMAWVINLSGCKFTPSQWDEFIDVLQAMGYIAELYLADSALTDDQLVKYDEGMFGRTVMELNLSNTAITDASIDKLEHFYCLRNVDLSGTKVTKDAVDRWMERRRQNENTPPIFFNPQIKM